MPATIDENASTEASILKMDSKTEQETVVMARLYVREKLVAEAFSWPNP
jgi:hypothetical protein